MRFGKRMRTLGDHLYEMCMTVWGTLWVVGCRLYEVWDVYGDLRGQKW